MRAFYNLIEQRIQDAMARGEFDELEGQGKPLKLDDDSQVPEDMRAAYRVLKNAGFIPEEATLRGDINRLEAEIEALADSDDQARVNAYKRLALLRARLDGRGQAARSVTGRRYTDRLVQKLTR
ncbi:MAG: DUF1992 domain-containing protein [Gammaproteobacteria bacterium]|nr:DUF1992 domain-containing protein [Gammaproteobacteria bacterium]